MVLDLFRENVSRESFMTVLKPGLLYGIRDDNDGSFRSWIRISHLTVRPGRGLQYADTPSIVLAYSGGLQAWIERDILARDTIWQH